MNNKLIFLSVSIVAIVGLVLQFSPQTTGNAPIDPERCIRLAENLMKSYVHPGFDRGAIGPSMVSQLNPCTGEEMLGEESLYVRQVPIRNMYEIIFENMDVYGYIGDPAPEGGNIQYYLCTNPDGSITASVVMSGVQVC